MQDKGVIPVTVRGCFSFPNSDGLRKKSITKSGKSVAQIVRLRIGLHIPLSASPATLYGVLLKQRVKHVFDFFQSREHVGTRTA